MWCIVYGSVVYGNVSVVCCRGVINVEYGSIGVV